MNEPNIIRRKSLSTDVLNALHWLQSIGIDTTKGRFAQYNRQLQYLENLTSIPDKLNDEAYDAAIELFDLILIHRGLSSLHNENIFDLLKIFVKGPTHAVDEKFSHGSSHKPRSTALELLTASHFALAGYTIRFETEADVEVLDENTLIHIECKRPSTYENFEKCIDEAYSQLRKRYSTFNGTQSQRGLVVLSISKFINPENKTLLLYDESETETSINQFMNSFLEKHRSLFYKNLDSRTLGIVLYFSIAISISGRRGTFLHRHLGSIYVSNINDVNIENKNPDRIYFREIITKLNQAFIDILAK